MKTLGRTILAAVVLNVTAAHAQQINVNKNNRTLAVTASASASAVADRAAVHVGFTAYGADSRVAYATASRLSNAIAQALARAGVAPDAIESESQNISETQPYELEKLTPEERAARRFIARQSWLIHTSAAKAAQVLNAAVDAGANQSGQIDWSVADENALEAKAAGKALGQARTIAAGMAAGLQIKLGALIYASNQAPSAEGPRPLMRAMRAASEPAGKTAPLAIGPQKVERSATVYAVFAIE